MAGVVEAFAGRLGDRLVQVVEENVSLLKEIKKQVEGLVGDIKNFDAYLEQASRNPRSNDNDVLKDVVAQMWNVVIKAEDAICKYTVEKKKHKDKGWLRYFQSPAYYSRITASAKEIKAIRDDFKEIWESNAAALQALTEDHGEAQPAIPVMTPVVEEDDVVGFDSEAKSIKDRLIEGPDDLTVISIEGMVGLGKTTLTNMVFKDTGIQYQFFTRLWIYVSRTMNRRRIFLDILSSFTRYIDEFMDLSEEKLADKIKKYLEGGRYFIVVDDVWTEDDWNRLQIAFPNNKKGSRVLLITRHHNVASHAASSGNLHQLKFLSNDESWKLLKKKVFRQEICPPPLEATGKSIAQKCNGLPLAVVVIAGVLNKDSTTKEWKRIAEDPFPIINRQRLSYNKLVRASYDHLQPYNLQDCFLYLAVYPTGHEIAAWKLIRLWISEGFIPQIDGGNSSELEVTAEKYLKELVDNNLLMVMKRRADGQIKTCRIIHDTLHVFCKTQAASKNMFHEMNGARFELNKTPRCLCVHSSIIEFLRSETKASGEHVRSFLSSCSNEKEIPTEHLAVIPKSFPLLRVLDIESLKLKSLPKQLYYLYHLRYLAVSTDLRCLPQGFNKFKSMQTLVFNTSQSQDDSLQVEADICRLTKLRHVRTNACMQLPLPSSNTESTGIQTLSFISPSSCTAEILGKTPNLQKLGIRGNIVELMHKESKAKEGRNSPLFENLGKLSRLHNLKLLNNGHRPSKLQSVPQYHMFPQSLRKLTLSNMWLKWKNMRILGALDELEVLKLKEHAFMGKSWDNEDTVFKQLRFLMIGRTDLEVWKTSRSCFPALEKLVLKDCTHLSKVPLDFAEVPSLKQMELYGTNEGAANSAHIIHRKQHDQGNNQFKLLIDPPHN